MFCYQKKNKAIVVVHCTRDLFYRTIDDDSVKWKIASIRSLRMPDAIQQWKGNTDYRKFCLKEGRGATGAAFKKLSETEKMCRYANALKSELPVFIFGARDFDETLYKNKMTKRRSQTSVHLSGLFMFDGDHIDDPKGIFDHGIQSGVLTTTPPPPYGGTEGGSEGGSWQVVLAHKTSSGKGLRLVCKARVDIGNIADNQIELAKALGIQADATCIDASRISYAPMREDIYYINEDELFDYYGKEYDEKFCESYRQKKTAPIDKSHSFSNEEKKNEKENGNENKQEIINVEKNENGELCYHGVPYQKICQAWQEANGGKPKPGDRHHTMLQMAGDLRYICDNNPDLLLRVLSDCEFVREIMQERGEGEVRNAADSNCARQFYQSIPKRLQAVLESVGAYAGQPEKAGRPVAGAEIPYEEFAQRLQPLLSAPYAEAVKAVSRQNWLGAVYASGAMYCTLLTRCWYKHFDGSKQRMNPQVLIIGHPASGKSLAEDLDDQIMCSMRAQDEEVRAQETRYKQEQKKRGTSSKAQKGDALVEPEGMIRYLPTKTSNNIFFRRLKRAKEIVDGEQMPLHLYMFDSELDSSISAQSGGAWIGKHDLELKAFHNELSGVDYANNDSINDILPVHWNSVTTGTSVSLHKKFNLRNINDGLCSRVAIFQMERNNYQMIRKNIIDWQNNEKLKQWGFNFERLHGELPLGRLVDHVYSLCEMSAEEAKAADDLVLDYLRKRAVFYATWFTIPRIIARQYEDFRKTGKLEITDDDLAFATLMYDSVIYFQDYFFGQMLQDSWENAEREYVPRRKNSRNAEAYKDLPDRFTINDVMKVLDIENHAARKQCERWLKHGFVKRPKQGKYEKVIKEIVV